MACTRKMTGLFVNQKTSCISAITMFARIQIIYTISTSNKIKRTINMYSRRRNNIDIGSISTYTACIIHHFYPNHCRCISIGINSTRIKGSSGIASRSHCRSKYIDIIGSVSVGKEGYIGAYSYIVGAVT